MYEALYMQNRGLLIRLAKRYARVCALDRAVSVEDLVQAGFFALVRAAQSYDPAGDKSWASWASWHIQREYQNMLGVKHGRFTRADTGAAALDAPLQRPMGDGETLKDRLPDDSLPEVDAALLAEELRRGVRAAVARVPDLMQRRTMELCGLQGYTARQAADRLGITAVRARRLYDRASVRMSGDRGLRALADLDARTRFHAHKGVAAFNRDWTSVTEGAALWRIEQQRKGTQLENDP